MRTTLDLDEDVLLAIKARAKSESTSIGKLISALVRGALTASSPSRRATVGGFRPFATRGTPVTDELIDALRDKEGV